jgi:hypothetical protein
MAELAERVRARLPEGVDVSERRMFGSLVFMLDGNMAVAARGSGELMVRTGREPPDEPGVRPVDMGARRMKGWVVVDAGHAGLDGWIDQGIAFARSLPPKG